MHTNIGRLLMRYAHHYPESLRGGVEVLDRMKEKFSTISDPILAQSKEEGITVNV